MLIFLNSLLIMIRAIHQAGIKNTMLHSKSMAELVIDNFYQKIYIYLILILLMFLSFIAIAFFYDLFE